MQFRKLNVSFLDEELRINKLWYPFTMPQNLNGTFMIISFAGILGGIFIQ